MDVQVRQALAVEASQTIAAKYGVPCGHPTILNDTNHTIVHLNPFPIVAKVSVEKRFRHASSSLERELVVAGATVHGGTGSERRSSTPNRISAPG
jgi:hypothetical protein